MGQGANYVMDSTSQASEAEKVHSLRNKLETEPQLKGRRRKRKNPSKLRSDMEGTITKRKCVSKSQCERGGRAWLKLAKMSKG